MEIKKVKLKDIKLNPSNPRIIKDIKFQQLVKSIQDFPAMLEIRPIVVNDDMIVLGGNMRLRACQEAKLKEVPIIVASQLTLEEQKQFIIKDNVGYGEWDWDMIANDWNTEELAEWGLEIPVWNGNDDEDKENESDGPTSSDDDYSLFELVMLHENKLTLLETLNKVKQNYLFEKQEEALMEVLRVYNNNN
jgi:hypothetical protein